MNFSFWPSFLNSSPKNDHFCSCAESGKALHEVEKSKRAIEVERNDLQAALEEAEGAIEAEESKVLRLQVELAQIKQDIDRRIREKEEENDNQRRNSQRAMESMQTTLDSEIRARAEVSNRSSACPKIQRYAQPL